MMPTTASTRFHEVCLRQAQIELTLKHISGERSEVERNAEWMDPAAYLKRLDFLDCVAAWYREDSEEIKRTLRDLEASEPE